MWSSLHFFMLMSYFHVLIMITISCFSWKCDFVRILISSQNAENTKIHTPTRIHTFREYAIRHKFDWNRFYDIHFSSIFHWMKISLKFHSNFDEFLTRFSTFFITIPDSRFEFCEVFATFYRIVENVSKPINLGVSKSLPISPKFPHTARCGYPYFWCLNI
jgi:hypothetical protein